MRNICRDGVWRRVHWMKLFIFGAMMTTISVVIQTLTLPFPLDMWFPSPQIKYSSNSYLNVHTQLKEVLPFYSAPKISSKSSDGKIERVLVRRRRGRRRRSSKKDWKRLNMDDYPEISVSSPPLTPSQEIILSLPPNEAVAYVKKELDNPPLVTDNPDLHVPLFLNVSVFKRSYELMELILKVYIYPNGNKPIFHEPHLVGIYASEGWFMKLLEMNSQFVTKDPEKAHLFYLPYSARQLQRALYVPGSHNIKPLSIFLKDYANMIAAKYPFWNRTDGRDHFLVACHDWGPYTLTMHEGLTHKVIKALCNADVSEGIFNVNKDVSLPETTIRYPGRPLRAVGRGNRVSQRPILAFFAGNMHGRVRPRLLKYWRDKDDDMKIYGPLPLKVSKNMSYIQHMKSSKYCLCPMGHEVNSPRIVESIYYECVPVIIADNFALPFSDVLNWKAFSIVVAEKDIPKLKEILLAIPLRRYQTLQANVKMVQKHFLWNPRPKRYDLFHMILHSIWLSMIKHIHSREI